VQKPRKFYQSWKLYVNVAALEENGLYGVLHSQIKLSCNALEMSDSDAAASRESLFVHVVPFPLIPGWVRNFAHVSSSELCQLAWSAFAIQATMLTVNSMLSRAYHKTTLRRLERPSDGNRYEVVAGLLDDDLKSHKYRPHMAASIILSFHV